MLLSDNYIIFSSFHVTCVVIRCLTKICKPFETFSQENPHFERLSSFPSPPIKGCHNIRNKVFFQLYDNAFGFRYLTSWDNI